MLKGELEVKKRRKEKERMVMGEEWEKWGERQGGFWEEWEGEGQKQKGRNNAGKKGGLFSHSET